MPFELRQPLLVHTQPTASADARAAQPVPAFRLTAAAAVAEPAASSSPTLLIGKLPPVGNLQQPPGTGTTSGQVAVTRSDVSLLLDPRILGGVGLIGVFNAPRPRSAFHLPTLIAPLPPGALPGALPVATTIFEEPEDATHKHYVPSYSLASTRRGTSDVKWVAFEPGDQGGWALTVHLNPAPAPAAPAGATMAPLPPQVQVRYSVAATEPQTNRLLHWDFDEAALEGSVLRLTLHLRGDDAMTQRDHLFRAMTDPAAGAKLTATYSVDVALPAAPAPPPPTPSPPHPLPVMTGLGRVDTTLHPLTAMPLRAGTAALAAPLPARPIGEVLGRPGNTGVGLIRLPRDPGPIDRPPIRPRPIDPLPTPPPPPEPLFRSQRVTLSLELPFTFDRDLDANVFESLVGMPATGAGLNSFRSTWLGRAYPYFQEADQPEVFYFVPDAFKVARRPQSPHLPLLAVTVEGETIDAARFALSYLALPVWHPQRIAAAAVDLLPHSAPGKAPKLVPLEAAGPKLRLKLPSDAGPAFVDQDGALVNLVAGIRGSVTLALTPFQRVYSALFDAVGELLSGEVQVTVGKDLISIPFSARAGDLVGEIFDRTEEVDTASGGLKMTLRNAIESPIHIEGLTASLVKGDALFAAEVRSLVPPAPVTLAPATPSASGEALVAIVALAGPAAGGAAGGPVDASYDALFDLSKATVQPDPQKMWDVILDKSVVTSASRAVSVRLLAATFDANAAKRIFAAQVEFETGASATFEAPATPPAAPFLTQDVQIAIPLADFVLSRPDAGSYRYRVRTVSATGIDLSDWQSAASDVLFVVIPLSPPAPQP
jgi:hypothetical protein